MNELRLFLFFKFFIDIVRLELEDLMELLSDINYIFDIAASVSYYFYVKAEGNIF